MQCRPLLGTTRAKDCLGLSLVSSTASAVGTLCVCGRQYSFKLSASYLYALPAGPVQEELSWVDAHTCADDVVAMIMLMVGHRSRLGFEKQAMHQHLHVCN